jgi:hypothetical protein
MSIERPSGSPAPAEAPPGLATGDSAVPIAVRLQILSTEHWSLLSTRSLTWSESFSRASMFLSALSGAVVALALVAQASAFGEAFVVFSLVLLPVVFFIGFGTYVRLVQANLEDARWVSGMNRLRHAYLEIAPELEPYFITGSHDDETGLVVTAAAAGQHATGVPRSTSVLQGLVTTPVTVGVIDSVVGAVLVGVIAGRLQTAMVPSVGLGVAAFLVIFASMAAYYLRAYRTFTQANRPLFPTPKSRE